MSTHSKVIFFVSKEMFYLSKESGELKGFMSPLNALGKLEETVDIRPDIIRNIEKNLRLNFVSEQEKSSNVCMANSPEIRNDYMQTFDIKDLFNYVYAVLHSPDYREKYKDLSVINFFQIPYPDNQNQFWKLVGIGSQLHYSNTKS